MRSNPVPRWPRGARAAAPVAALLLLAAAGLGARAADPGAPAEPAYPHGHFTGDCSECHGDQGWKPARIRRSFDHAKRSGFVLDGAHATVPCTACHASLDFSQPKSRCISCHQDPHLGELGSDCARCHTARSFLDRQAMVRMHQMTRLPLVGAHAGLDCESCHPLAAQGHLRFRGVDAGCRSCHAPGTVPDHAAFSSDCALCHTMVAWQPARFDHAGTGFPLTCPHRPPVTCVQCHGQPWTNALPTDCYACHKAAYDATTDPAHAAAGFPTTCATCHNVNVCGWAGASFDHTRFFPLTGSHAGLDCTTCHTTAGNFAAFSCTSGGCHPQATTDSRHAGVSGYRYDSAACYSCHPRAGGGG